MITEVHVQLNSIAANSKNVWVTAWIYRDHSSDGKTYGCNFDRDASKAARRMRRFLALQSAALKRQVERITK